MRQSALCLMRLACAGAVCLTLSAQAQTAPGDPPSSDANLPEATLRHQKAEIARGDPARWFQEDASAAARLRTIRKEIAAGLQESLGGCKRLPAAERGACMAEARAIYKQEMAGAQARAMAGQ